jgi:hypothetical protein
VTVPADTAVSVPLSCAGQEVVYEQPTAPTHGTLSDLNAPGGSVLYTPDAGYSGPDSFTYTAHNAAGTSNSAAVTVTVLAGTPSSSGEVASLMSSVAPGNGLAAPPIQVTPSAPTLTNVGQTAGRWLEARKRGAHSKLSVGTTISFTLNEHATVRLYFGELVAGESIAKKCVARAHSSGPAHKRCTLMRAVGTLTVAGAPGANSVKFKGLLPGRAALAPGRYELRITATAAGGMSNAARLSFTIASPP